MFIAGFFSFQNLTKEKKCRIYTFIFVAYLPASQDQASNYLAHLESVLNGLLFHAKIMAKCTTLKIFKHLLIHFSFHLKKKTRHSLHSAL